MTTDDRRFPEGLAAALAVPFRYDGGDGVEFEPFPRFLSADETTAWFRAWIGNAELTGADFRLFGQDGTGGCAAFWLARPEGDPAAQPVVFLGSEGETAVVARDLADFLWLLAGGYGPLEAIPLFAEVRRPGWTPRFNPELAAVAQRFAPGAPRAAADVIRRAVEEFPDFESTVDEMCR
ncbi:SMI1/KNR4 family protein [Streptomyces sp. NPDC087440]|uniref:SMI1/KNR4 family protein n=1 Tax=Streptomyces sp. NPDC087440 TaxID=3365790 RepID=UPI0038136EB7